MSGTHKTTVRRSSITGLTCNPPPGAFPTGGIETPATGIAICRLDIFIPM
jgi:hypothetical protein